MPVEIEDCVHHGYVIHQIPAEFGDCQHLYIS